ncbi:hypothetical protein BKA69DRAFT_1055504 [Paraphysoderma sedebokerense]|nr:hypothetical protein BKA69DRAFT_1055504 [Paraphysoderma sedebokerense]
MKQKLKQQFNTLAIFIHSLVSQYATFELQTNCLVYGKVDHVDDDLNVTLGDVTLQRLNVIAQV